MAQKGNPISVRLDLNRSSDSSWFSDYYYGLIIVLWGISQRFKIFVLGSKPMRCLPIEFRIISLLIAKFVIMALIFRLSVKLGILFMDELGAALAPFYPGFGGMSESVGGGSGGSGGTSFDFGVLPGDDDEGAQPNPQNSGNSVPVVALDQPTEADVDNVKSAIRQRLLIHRLGTNRSLVGEEEVNTIFDLKSKIVERMAEINPNPFWSNRKLFLISKYLQPARGGEFSVLTLERKLQQLFTANPKNEQIYKDLLKAKADILLFHS